MLNFRTDDIVKTLQASLEGCNLMCQRLQPLCTRGCNPHALKAPAMVHAMRVLCACDACGGRAAAPPAGLCACHAPHWRCVRTSTAFYAHCMRRRCYGSTPQAFNMIKYFGGQHSIYVSPKTLDTYYTSAKPNCAKAPCVCYGTRLSALLRTAPECLRPNPALATDRRVLPCATQGSSTARSCSGRPTTNGIYGETPSANTY